MCAKANAPTSICVNQLVALQGPVVNDLITNANEIDYDSNNNNSINND